MDLANLIKANLYLLEGNYGLSIEEFKKLVISDNAPKEIYILLGSVLRKNGEYEKAIHIHESLVGDKTLTNKLNKILYFELVKDYKELQEYKKSLYYAQKLLDIDKSPIIYKYFYELNLSLKNFDDAFKYLLKYQKGNKSDFSKELSYILYEKYVFLEKKDDSLIKKALKFYPNNRPVNLILFDQVYATGKKSKISDAFEDLLKKDIIKTEKDLKKFENDFFAIGLYKDFESAVFKKVAQSSANPIYAVYSSNLFIKKNNPEKANEVLVNYLNNIGEKNIVKNKILTLQLPEGLKSKFKFSDIYVCSVCGTDFDKYYEYCPNCKSIETIDFK
ncbi:hypothetical protein LF845_07365 [Deferribacterales bacterium Es71-Z0220]|uniref:hypothetical protein n=1 Tax=Deferrivibrio essentukiensis TaxID=2880922 RepID=UPI001F616AB3|nr:hypothetical protein [Deferrivibrio essentukiensis]MCB4204778.1 hypothetical protein [Deferrivibrio essentukiensis]